MLLRTLLLQTAEIAKGTAEAAAGVTQHMNQQGPLFILLWLLVLVACGIALAFYIKYDKLVTGQREAQDKAVALAREEWAKQQAVDNGHAAEMLRYAREQEKAATDRLDKINQELRQQESKSVEVIGGVRNALSQVYGILHTVQHQLQAIESYINSLNNRPNFPHTPPPLPPTPIEI